jgi:hypothetical protein
VTHPELSGERPSLTSRWLQRGRSETGIQSPFSLRSFASKSDWVGRLRLLLMQLDRRRCFELTKAEGTRAALAGGNLSKRNLPRRRRSLALRQEDEGKDDTFTTLLLTAGGVAHLIKRRRVTAPHGTVNGFTSLYQSAERESPLQM